MLTKMGIGIIVKDGKMICSDCGKITEGEISEFHPYGFYYVYCEYCGNFIYENKQEK